MASFQSAYCTHHTNPIPPAIPPPFNINVFHHLVPGSRTRNRSANAGGDVDDRRPTPCITVIFALTQNCGHLYSSLRQTSNNSHTRGLPRTHSPCHTTTRGSPLLRKTLSLSTLPLVLPLQLPKKLQRLERLVLDRFEFVEALIQFLRIVIQPLGNSHFGMRNFLLQVQRGLILAWGLLQPGVQ